MCLFPREDLDWLAGAIDRGELGLSSSAESVLSDLDIGARFFNELPRASGLLASEVESALAELAASGLASADRFAAIRPLVGDSHERTRHNRSRLRSRNAGTSTSSRSRARRGPRAPSRELLTGPRAARWWRLPDTPDFDPDDRVESWAWLLLRRWGVVFRDLLERESLAPRWGELVRVYRRLEARGEIRGGRFVKGVGGEQFALEEAVSMLREMREIDPENEWLVISGADPLNLTGILAETRVPALSTHTLAFRGGRLTAVRRGDELEVLDPDLSPDVRQILEGWTMKSGETRARQSARRGADAPLDGARK